jgi:hypothetical protein
MIGEMGRYHRILLHVYLLATSFSVIGAEREPRQTLPGCRRLLRVIDESRALPAGPGSGGLPASMALVDSVNRHPR